MPSTVDAGHAEDLEDSQGPFYHGGGTRSTDVDRGRTNGVEGDLEPDFWCVSY
jgi:hypothetical protein